MCFSQHVMAVRGESEAPQVQGNPGFLRSRRPAGTSHWKKLQQMLWS